MRPWWLLAACAVFALRVSAETTGAIEGVVTDTSGAPLAGAAIEVASPHLQGVRTAVSGRDGRFRLPALPPGIYSIAADLEGFKRVERISIHVGVDGIAPVALRMELAATEEIIVTGEAPVVEAFSSGGGFRIRQEVARRLPLGRNYASVLEINPGVATDSAETQGRAQPFTVYGSTSVENQYLVDGVNTTNVIKGFQGKALSQEFIEEVQIKTSGYEPEYGRATGGIVNVVTKSGGNEYHGDAFGYFDRKAWTWGNRANAKEDVYTVDDSQRDREDWGVDLGGYVVKDRIWFFGAYNRVSEDVDQVPLGPASVTHVPTGGTNLPISSHTDIFAGKLTVRPTESTTVVGTAFGDPETRRGNLRNFTATNEALRQGVREVGATDWSVSVSQLFGTVGLATLRHAHHADRFLLSGLDDQPQVRQVLTSPGVANVISGFGGVFGPTENNESRRNASRADGALFVGVHELKAGLDFEDNATRSVSYDSGGQIVTIRDCAREARGCPANAPRVTTGGKTYSVFYEHAFYTGSATDPEGAYLPGGNAASPKTKRLGLFLQDSFRPLPSLTINAGLRWDREDVRDYTGASVFTLTDEWQPRVGVAWDVLGDGSSRLSASFGRYFYALPTDLNVRAYGAQTMARSFNFDPIGIAQAPDAPRAQTVQGSAQREPVQDDLGGIYQDEVTLGFDRALDPTLTLGARATYRTLGRTIEDRCDLDPRAPESNGSTCVIINPGSDSPYATGVFPDGSPLHTCDGRDYAPFVHEPGCNGPGAGAAVPKAKRQYVGLELVAKKRVASRLWAQASYVFSSLRGNYDGAARLGGVGTAGQTDPGLNADFDYALFQRNAYGRLALDRPHAARLDVAYTAPFGLQVGFQAYARSGAPKSRLVYFNSQYKSELYLTERGSEGREPTDYEINLSLAYQLHVKPVAVTLFAQAFDLLDRQQPVATYQGYTIDPPKSGEVFSASEPDNGAYGLVTSRKSPRRVRLGARVSF